MSVFSHIRFKEAGVAKDRGEYVHGEAFPYMLPKLDEIAESLGLTKPSRYGHQGRRRRNEGRRKPRGPAAKTGADAKSQDESQEDSDWHDCASAALVFRQLEKYFKSQSPEQLLELSREMHVADYHMSLEMRLFAKHLEAGAKRRDQFRIEAEV